MTNAELYYAMDINLDRIATQSNPDLNVAEKDWLLTEAQLMLIKQRFSSLSNPKRVGFEHTEKRIEDLATLVVKYPVQPPIPTTLLDTGVIEADLSQTVYPYLFIISAYANVNIGNDCYKSVPLKFVQHDDHRELLRDPFNSPSLEFIPYNLGLSSTHANPSMYIYTGDLPSTYINTVNVEYIRRPQRVSSGTYQYLDGITYPQTSLQVPEHLHLEVVDLACQLAALAIENPEYVQLRSQKISINE